MENKFGNLVTGLTTEIEGISIDYGRIPSGIIDGWDEIVYYFQTNISEEITKDMYESIIQKVISKLESQSFDHWSQWRKTRKEIIIFNEYCQITLVSFRVRDSY